MTDPLNPIETTDEKFSPLTSQDQPRSQWRRWHLPVLLLLAIAFRIIQIGSRQLVGSTELMCYGMATMIAFQVLVNVGVCLKILPVIGITLPFFSAGGSSTLCVYIGIGLILSFYRASKEKEIVNLRFTEFD